MTTVTEDLPIDNLITQIPIMSSSSPFLAGQMSSGPTLASSLLLVAPDAFRTRIRFEELARRWKNETDHISSITKTAMHPAYQAIIGMGREALPLILEDLAQHGGHWFWALHAITQEDPASGSTNFQETARAWLTWGRARGYI